MTAGGLVYSDVIRQRWRQPRFRGDVPDATATAEDVNPLCGDRVRMSMRVDDSTVAAVRFAGDACAICLASADVVAELTEGRSTAEAAAITSADVLAVLQADIRPSRMRCVSLPVDVLTSALEKAR